MITLGEYESKEVHGRPPPGQVQEEFQRHLAGRLEVLWLSNGRVRIQSFQWVGVVRLPDGRSIRIIPKLAGDELRVLAMLGFVGGLPPAEITELQRDLETSVYGDGLELICHLLTAASSRLLSSGPFQDYRNHRESLPYVRGRLDLSRQAFMHYGRVDVLACEFQEFDHDVLENRLLRTALERARLLSRNPGLRRRCAMLHDEFLAMAPGPMPYISEIKRSLHYDRRNEHYRAAHVWALALLEGQGVENPFRDAGFAISTFLIDMNSLFERFTIWLVTRSLSSNTVSVHPQHRDRTVLKSSGRPWGALKPDMLVSAAGSNLAIDAKYKRYDVRRIAPQDIYQLLVYAQAFPGFLPTPMSVLLHPSETQTTQLSIDLVPATHPVATVVTVAIQLPSLLDALVVGDGQAMTVVGNKLSSLLGLTERPGRP